MKESNESEYNKNNKNFKVPLPFIISQYSSTMERNNASKIFNELERSDKSDDTEAEEKALEQFR